LTLAMGLAGQLWCFFNGSRILLLGTFALLADGVNVRVHTCTCIANEQLEAACVAGGPISGSCVTATLSGVQVEYAATYGESCGKHSEPGQLDCSGADGFEKSVGRAAWCESAWCYVDPCTCSLADISSSTYFSGSSLMYSYETCGGKDTYTSTGQASSRTCSSGLFTIPTDTCEKLDNEAFSTACTEPWAHHGYCVDATVGGEIQK